MIFTARPASRILKNLSLNSIFFNHYIRRKLSTSAHLTATMKIGTHNGAFHCDEVLACAMLKLLDRYKDAEIVRSRDPAVLAECDVVVDVGGEFDPAKHRYDHHQKGFAESVSTLMKGKKWTTKLSSAGLVYVHFGKEIIAKLLDDSKDEVFVDKIFDKVYAHFMEEVDAHDNGVSAYDGDPRFIVSTDIGNRVAALRPAWNEPDQDTDKGFRKALDLVRPEFVDRVRYYGTAWWPARTLVAEAMERRFDADPSGRIIVLDQSCPYREHLWELEREQDLVGQILYGVFEDVSNSSWRVAAVSVEGRQFESRLKLPEEWRALRDDKLSKVSGIDECVFVHAAGFIGGNWTKKGALLMAAKAVELHKEKIEEEEN